MGRRLPGFIRTVLILAVLAAGIQAPDIHAAPGEEKQGHGILRATLNNGLRVVIVSDPLFPAVTTVVNYLVGSNESPEGFPGMAHAQEHMMFRGSHTLSAEQLLHITAALGGQANADTQYTVTRYHFTVPVQDLDTVLTIESIRMREVLNTDGLWSVERGAMEQEVAQALSSPEYLFFTRIFNAMFRGTPYEHNPLGTMKSFEKTTGAMFRKFHKAWYVPNNAVLLIVGNVDPRAVLATVRQLFGDIPSRKTPARREIRLRTVKHETIRMDTDKPDGMVTAAFRMPGHDSPDYAASLVLADILDSRRGRLYSLVPQGKALDTSFEYLPLSGAGLGLAIVTFPQGTDIQALTRDLQSALSAVVKDGVSPDMVEAAKRHIAMEAELQKNSIKGLAMAWSQALAVEGRRSPDDDVNAVRRVSLKDVNRAAHRYLALDHAITGSLTPRPSGRAVTGIARTERDSSQPARISPVEIPRWAQSSLKNLSIPTSTLHPVVNVLANGITLIVQSESTSRTVSVYGRIRNRPELSVPPGKEGVDGVLRDLFPFGTTSLDREAFLKAVDDIGATVTAGDAFSLEVLSEHFEHGVELLADNVIRPSLPQNAFEIIRTRAAAQAAGRLKSPDFLADRAVLAGLYPKDDPQLRQALPETISRLTLADVKEYYHTVFRPDMAVIVVMGRVTPEHAREVVERYFDEWKSPGSPRPETFLPPVPANNPSSVAVPNPSRVQSTVFLAQTLDITRSDPDYYALQLGNHILGGSLFASRLFRDLRESSGLVYRVSSDLRADQTRAVFSIKYACDPRNMDRARAIVESNLRDMQENQMSAEELDRTKALMLRQILLSESSVEGIALGFIHRKELDLPLDEPSTAARRYRDLEAREVKEAFARHLRPGSLVRVIEGPDTAVTQ